MLEPQDIETLQGLMRERMGKDVALLDELRDEMKDFNRSIRRIRGYSVNTISIVGTDGGNNNLRFDPFIVHVIRVVDSNNKEYYMDVITPTTSVDELENRIKSRNDPLKDMMESLEVSSITQLTTMIKKLKPGEAVSPSWINVYRELVEWATLFSLIKNNDFISDTLIVFDGLLRSKVFSKGMFYNLKTKIIETIKEKEIKSHCRIFVVGVAKHSKVLDRYNMVMCIDGVMKTKYPCYGAVPRSMEENSYIWSEYARDDEAEGKNEVNNFVAGKMFLVKFGNSPNDPIWPVDILTSQEKDSDEILGYLLNDAALGFPIPWYPMCLQKAHENSALVDFDMDIIQGQIIDSIRESVGDAGERFDEFLMSNTDIAARRYW